MPESETPEGVSPEQSVGQQPSVVQEGVHRQYHEVHVEKSAEETTRENQRLAYWAEVLERNPQVLEYRDAESLKAMEDHSMEEDRRGTRVEAGIENLQKSIDEGHFNRWFEAHHTNYEPTFIGSQDPENQRRIDKKLARESQDAAAEDALEYVLPKVLNDRSKTIGDLQDAVVQRMKGSADRHKKSATEMRGYLDKLVKNAFPEEQKTEAPVEPAPSMPPSEQSQG